MFIVDQLLVKKVEFLVLQTECLFLAKKTWLKDLTIEPLQIRFFHDYKYVICAFTSTIQKYWLQRVSSLDRLHSTVIPV